MKHFALRTIIFILPLFSFLAFLEFKLQFNSDSYYAIKSNCLKNKLSQCKLIVLGSSIENSGIKPEIIDEDAINLALIGGTSFDTFEKLVSENLPSLVQLRHVIIPISTFSFFATENRDELAFRKVLLHKYFGINKDQFKNPLNRFLLPHIGLKKAIKQFIIPSKVVMTSSGFEINNEFDPKELTQEKGKLTVLRHVGDDKKSLDMNQYTKNLNTLKNIIKVLQINGIKTHLISTPTHKFYYTNINPEILQLISQTARSVAQEYKIDYFNYLDDPRFVDSDFFNCDHLNHQGAIKFSKILKTEVFHQ